MKKIVFATNNTHKIEEVRTVLHDKLRILSLKDISFYGEIPETAETLEGNALIKAQFIYDKFEIDCFADDTGLEVDALNGCPGVNSARYAGDDNDAQKNMQKLLSELEGKTNRKARFRTVLALVEEGRVKCFEGIVEGEIIKEARGTKGFGYDPIFIPEGYTNTFVELGDKIKNKISHRALAINKLNDYLNKKAKI